MVSGPPVLTVTLVVAVTEPAELVAVSVYVVVDVGFTLVDPLADVDVNVPGVMAMLAAAVVTQLSVLAEPELTAVGVAVNEVMTGFAAFTLKLCETGVAAAQTPFPPCEA